MRNDLGRVIPDGISVCGGHTGGVLVVSLVELGYRLCWWRAPATLERNRLRLPRRLMVTGPGHRPVLPQPLPLPSLGYHYLQCVTSDSLGQALKQSILHNLENQPSLQKQRGNIGNKDGYIIWRQAFFSCWLNYLLSGRWGWGRGRGGGRREGARDLSEVRGGGQTAWINVQITVPNHWPSPSHTSSLYFFHQWKSNCLKSDQWKLNWFCVEASME